MQIAIKNASGLPVIDYRKVQPLQGDLKDLREENYKKLKNVLSRRGFEVPLFIWIDPLDKQTYLLDGHQRARVMLKEDMNDHGDYEVPYVLIEAVDKSEAKAKLLEITSQYGTMTYEGWDAFTADLNEAELLEMTHFDALPLLGIDPEDEDAEEHAGNLAERFIVPPFSVLDTRQGYWQARKRSWLELGIESEVGRDGNLLFDSENIAMFDHYRVKNGTRTSTAQAGVSIFDPVLCELMYLWFCPPQGSITDPFAGGSVRGILANRTGHKYTGFELRSEQVAANKEQAATLCTDEPMPLWIAGDSNVTLDSHKDLADMVFTCPPYADLEVYSDDPADLSNMPYDAFLAAYRSIIAKAASKLRPDRFMVLVVGEVRDKKGIYRNFVADTISAARDAGLNYYNELILVNAIGSLPLRAGKQFNASRKIGKTHQNVLVFYKGDPKHIKISFPALEMPATEDEPIDN